MTAAANGPIIERLFDVEDALRLGRWVLLSSHWRFSMSFASRRLRLFLVCLGLASAAGCDSGGGGPAVTGPVDTSAAAKSSEDMRALQDPNYKKSAGAPAQK
jgi:hypothetical protein